MTDKLASVIDFFRYCKNDQEELTIILGAGASVTAGIPSAPDIAREAYNAFPHLQSNQNLSVDSDYPTIMRYLNRKQIKQIIEPLLKDAQINWGHIALAQLVKKGYVSRVLTFNFDPVFQRALALLDCHIPIYDFGIAPQKYLSSIASPSLIHLHGQSEGLKQVHRETDSEAHSQSLAPLFEDCFKDHNTIIIGYSGDSDNAFPVMQKAYDQEAHLFWLEYAQKPNQAQESLTEGDLAEFIGGCDFDETMIAFCNALNIWPPKMLNQPIRHQISILKQTANYPDRDKSGDRKNIYSSVIERLENTADEWDKAPEYNLEKTLRTAFMQKDYSEELAAKINTEHAKGKFSESLSELASNYFNNWGNAILIQALRTDDKSKAIALFQKAEEKYQAALKIKPDDHKALSNWGLTIYGQAERTGDKSKAIALFQKAEEKYQAALEIKHDKHEALYNWGNAILIQALRTDDKSKAIALFQKAEEKYQAALKIKPDDHKALSNWTIALIYQSYLLKKPKADALRKQALELCQKAKDIEGLPNYNFACINALFRHLDIAVDELEACRDAGSLPDKAYLNNDKDLISLKNHPRFITLLDSL